MRRVGFYCWAGSGTIRMINLKFFNPPIDKKSLMTSYDVDYLKEVREKFGVTDVWVTYSWGFSEKTEKEDQKFIVSKVKNFKKLNLKVHAYIQGCNLVYEDFKEKDWWAKDEKGRLTTYYRGRKVVCINNPQFLDYKIRQVRRASSLGFDGIFMDNIQMGQWGPKPVFTGCNCKICQDKFLRYATNEYSDFRVDSVNNFLTNVSRAVHEYGMEFGTNSYDPKFDLRRLFGIDLKYLNKMQDYLLFENHALTSSSVKNDYIKDIKKGNKLTKPIFVVSYRKGIGYDSEYCQQDFDNLYTSAFKNGFNLCIKGSEYTTNGVWHNLRVSKFSKMKVSPNFKSEKTKKKHLDAKLLRNGFIKFLLKRYYNRVFTLYMESKLIRKMFEPFYGMVVS